MPSIIPNNAGMASLNNLDKLRYRGDSSTVIFAIPCRMPSCCLYRTSETLSWGRSLRRRSYNLLRMPKWQISIDFEHRHGGNGGAAEFIGVCGYDHAQCGSKEGNEGYACPWESSGSGWWWLGLDVAYSTLAYFDKDKGKTAIKYRPNLYYRLDEDECKVVEPVARVY